MSSLLPPESVNGLQSFMRTYTMPDRCILRTRTATTNAARRQSLTWTESAPIPCRLSARGGGEALVGGRETATARFRLTVHPTDAVSLRERDQVQLIELQGQAVDRLFEVAAFQGERTWGIVRNYELVELL